jgi:phenylalanyl-tRNA synthetase beta chain
MLLSLNWLQRHLPGLNAEAEELERVLPMIGLEVDAVHRRGLPESDLLVVGEVLSREQHPNADRLGVCEVDTGEGGARQIVCGASNYKVGDRVPVALPGAVLPGDFTIRKSKLRGVESHGMMCSARELGLGEDHEGLLILEGAPPVGRPMHEVFTDRDVIFELEVTANRGDCLSHRGVARELAAWYALELAAVTTNAEAPRSDKPDTQSLLRDLRVETPNCPYYTAWCIRGVSVGPSPDWLRRDIEAVGLRPVSNVVDITNWILMDLGQPLHAFDPKKIGGETIVVRQARTGETITTLDERKRTLDERVMVIADAEKPLVIAGVMGSLEAEVDADTTDIVLETAWFEPGSIRTSARRLGLSTDSAYRFARNVDPGQAALAARRAVDLILEVAGGTVAGPEIVVGAPPRAENEVAVTGEFIRRVSGFEVGDAVIAEVFGRLGFGLDETGPGAWRVSVPSFKWEVTRPVDLAEEFIRIHGAAKIPERRVRAFGSPREDDALSRYFGACTALLTARGYAECCHYSLRPGEECGKWFGAGQEPLLALENALTSEHSHLRPSLLPGLLDALALNLNNGNDVRGLFECGRVFRAHDGALSELASVGFVLLPEPAARTWKAAPKADFFTTKAIVADLLAEGGVGLDDGRVTGVDTWPTVQEGHAAAAYDWPQDGCGCWFGLVSFAMLKAWGIDLPVLFGEVSFLPEHFERAAGESAGFRGFSSFPPSTRDVALVVDRALAAEAVRRSVCEAAEASCGEGFGVEAVEVFDVFEGQGLPEGKKSLAFGIRFRSNERTLKDEEINAAFDQTLQRLQNETDFVVRR